MPERISISVGPKNADIIGSDNRALQGAIDYVAGLDGGIVNIGVGTYMMNDSLHLRSNVSIIGQGKDTILKKSDSFSSPLATDGDYGQEEVTPKDPSGFKVGMGVTITDDNSGGFHTTVATIIAQNDDMFTINKPLNADYMVFRNATVKSTFPFISGYYIEIACIEKVTIDGNKENNDHLNGCRGAGIFLYRAKKTLIKNCTVHDYNGDGISFQQSDDTIIENCVCRNNSSLGFHPGSGSQRPIMKNNVSNDNGTDGIFLCWRVKKGLFEGNETKNNGQFGFSIGHKDTDNVFRNNIIIGNSRDGVFFRNEPEYTGGHRNLLENNIIAENGTSGSGSGVCIRGETYDITIINNEIKNNKNYGILIESKADRIKIKGNSISGNEEGDIKNETLNAEIEITD